MVLKQDLDKETKNSHEMQEKHNSHERKSTLCVFCTTPVLPFEPSNRLGNGPITSLFHGPHLRRPPIVKFIRLCDLGVPNMLSHKAFIKHHTPCRVAREQHSPVILLEKCGAQVNRNLNIRQDKQRHCEGNTWARKGTHCRPQGGLGAQTMGLINT